MDYFVLALLWIIWCSIHSGMISITVTGFLNRKLGIYYRFYRLFYNFIALSTFIPLVLYGSSLKGQVLFRWGGSTVFLQLVLLFAAVTLFILGGIKYDMLRFLGIRQIQVKKSSTLLSESGSIDSSGIFALTRHPWYLAAIVFIWVDYREMYVSTLIANIILTIYLIIGTIIEERKLVIECGDHYRNYQKKVSMLFPFKWLISKLKNSG